MSIERLKPGRGIWLKCNGTDETECDEKRYTANIVPKHNRAYWRNTEGWGRGLRSHTETRDFCPEHMLHEQNLVAKIRAERAAAKKLKLEAMKLATEIAAKKKAEPKPKKPRKRKASASSPSADSHPAPAT